MNEKLLENKLKEEGACLVGFCRLENTLPDFPNLKYAISIAVKLSDSVLSTIKDKPTISYFHHYRTVNTRLDQLALTATLLIEKLGYNAFPIAASQSDNTGGNNYSGVFQHKTVARLSGLGYIGKNALFITNEFGSKVRFATVITDMELTSSLPIIENGCGDCQICVKSCPAGAISGKNFSVNLERNEFFDAEKCSAFMKTFKDVGRGAVCGICISVCPKNKKGIKN